MGFHLNLLCFPFCEMCLQKRSSDSPLAVCSNLYSTPQLTLLTPHLFFFLVFRAVGEYSHIRKQFVKLLLRIRETGWNKKMSLFESSVF